MCAVFVLPAQEGDVVCMHGCFVNSVCVCVCVCVFNSLGPIADISVMVTP